MKNEFIAIIWLISVLFLSWVPAQDDFHLILPAVFLSFLCYIYLWKSSSPNNIVYLISIAIIARIAVIPTLPNLSDDIYRFIWDGRLWQAGIHPFSVTPSEIVGVNSELNQALYEHLNSAKYYSIYPPVAQSIFWLSTLVNSESLISEVIIMKSVHALFDVGTILLLMKLLKVMQLNVSRVLLYAFNPLIVIEFVSNLHHEGILIFFVLLTLWLLHHHRTLYSGLSLSMAIGAKILPVIYIPLIFFSKVGTERLKFLFATFLGSTILFGLLIQSPQILLNTLDSANLYIQKFEFNASIYYILRTLGYWISGYNEIQIIGPSLVVLAVIGIGYIAYRFRNKISDTRTFIILMMWTYCCYAFLSPTLHPWYIGILVTFSLFTPFRFPILWSFMILLTYINYSFAPYHEVTSIVIIEYFSVFFLMIYEVKKYGFLATYQNGIEN